MSNYSAFINDSDMYTDMYTPLLAEYRSDKPWKRPSKFSLLEHRSQKLANQLGENLIRKLDNFTQSVSSTKLGERLTHVGDRVNALGEFI